MYPIPSPTPAGVPVPRTPVDDDPIGTYLQELGSTSRGLGDAAVATLERAVATYRACGYSWADVGRRLGLTRQAAHQRFRHLDTERVVVVRVLDAFGKARAVLYAETVDGRRVDLSWVAEHERAALQAQQQRAAIEAGA